MKLSKVRTIAQLTAALGIPETWSFLLIGDGSGNHWEYPVGWCATLVHNCGWRRCFYGGASHGTNNVGELMAYALPLWWLAEGNQPEWLPKVKGVKPPIRFVHVIADSKYVVDGFNDKTRPKANVELWGALQATKRRGLVLQAHWIPRDTIRFNKLADQVAGECRLAMNQRNTVTSKGLELSVQDYASRITPAEKPAE